MHDETINKEWNNKHMNMRLMKGWPKQLKLLYLLFLKLEHLKSHQLRYLRYEIHSITVKELQVTLKIALKKIETLDVKNKLGIESFDEENITRSRSNCKNPKLRNIYLRLIHNDFFTHVRMKKYRMMETDECPQCNMTETTKHLLWECIHVEKIWRLFNDLMNHTENGQECVNNYENVFQTCELPAISIVKTKII
jgi:hypothetical protein